MATYSDQNIELYFLEDTAAGYAINKRDQMLMFITNLYTLAYTANDGSSTSYYSLLLDTDYDTKTAIRHITLNSTGSVGMGTEKGHLLFTNTGTDNVQFKNCNVAIGAVTPDDLFHVYGGDSGDTVNSSNTIMVIEDNDTAYVTFKTPDASAGGIRFSCPTNTNDGIIYYDQNSRLMAFGAGGSEAVYIDSGQQVGIGTSTMDCLLHVMASSVSLEAYSDTVICAEKNDNCYISILSGSESASGIIFGNADGSNNNASIYYDHNTTTLAIKYATSFPILIGDGALGFFGSSQISQPSSTGETTGFTAGTGTGVNDDSTFTGNVGSTAYRLSDIVKHLKNLGLIAS